MTDNLDLAFQAIDELAAQEQARGQQAATQPAALPQSPTAAEPESRERWNPAFDVFDEMQTERSRSSRALTDGDATKAAQVRDLSERYGTSRTAAEINFESLFAQANRDDADEALTESPALAHWFAENQKDAPIFKKDLGLLSRLEEHFRRVGSRYSSDPNVAVDAQPNARYWDTEDSTGDEALDERITPLMNSSQIGRGAQAGWLIGEQGLAWARVSNDRNLLTEEFRQQDAEIDRRIEELSGDDSDAALYNAGQVLGTMAKSMLGGMEGATAGGALATAGMAAGAIPVAGQALAGAMAVGAGAYGTYQLEGGLQLKTLIEQGVPYEKAVKIASGVGFVNSLIEMAGIKVLGEAVAPAMRGLTSRFASRTAVALERPSMSRALIDTARAVGLGVGQEVVTESLQEVTNVVGEEIGRIWGETGAEGITSEQFFDRILEVAEMTAKGSAVLGALGAGPVMAGHMRRIAKANETQAFFEDLTQTVSQMEGANLSPGATKELIDGIAQDAGAGTIYIDGYAFRQVMAENNVSPEDLDGVIPGISQRVDAAAVNGTDVTMSTGDFAARLAASPFGQKLVPHMRLNESDMSQAEGQSLETAVKQMRRAAVKDAITPEDQRIEAIDDASRKIQDQFFEQISATGKFTRAEARQQAAWGARVVTNWAKRTGIPAEKLMDRVPVISTDVQVRADAQGFKQELQSYGTKYERKLASDEKAWAEVVDSFEPNSKSWMKPHEKGAPRLMLSQVPLVYFVAKVFPRSVPLYASTHLFDGSHPEMTPEMLKALPRALTEPIAIFPSKTRKGRVVSMVEIRDASGATVIVPIEINARGQHGAELNIVNSAYAKRKEDTGEPQNDWFVDQINDKNAPPLYVDRAKLQAWVAYTGSNSLRARPDVEASVPGRDALDKLRAELNDRYYQNGGYAARGVYSPISNTIHLTPNADLSTFAHEMGHWYLENIIDLSAMPEASEALKADTRALLKDFGLESVEAWKALKFEEKERLHERFAYQVELYLAEGKAPSRETEGFFRRLGLWIRDVYRAWLGGARDALNQRYRGQFGEDLPEISEEVRRVLDRMIAGEDAVSQVEEVQSLMPLFETKPEGMTEAEWAEYQAEHDDAAGSAAEELTRAQAKDESWYARARSKALKDIQKKAEETRANVRKKVAIDVNSRREVVALDLMKAGNRASVTMNLKLAPQALEDLGLNVNQIARLRALGVVREGGVTVDVARELLRPFARFNSSRQLIAGLLTAGDKERIIDDLTTQECLSKYSELFDPVQRDRLVTRSLHNEARSRMVASELKYLLGNKTLSQRVYRAAARQTAMTLVDRTRIGRAKASTFLAAEGRAARKAQEAFRKGDRDLAATFKRQQLVNHEAARIVLDAENKKEKLKDLRNLVFRKDKKLASRYDTNILAIARVILTNRNMGKVVDSVDEAVESYLDKIKRYDEDLLDGLKDFIARHPYSPGRDPNMLSVAEFVGVVEDVQALVKMARDARQVTLEGRKESLDEAVKSLTDYIDKSEAKEFAPGTQRAATKKEERQKLWFSARAYVMRVENWCRAMDGGENSGPFTRLIYRPVAQAAAKYRTKNNEIQQRFAELMKPMQEKWDAVGEIEAPELNYTFGRKSELIGALMHIGNESNKMKLLVGGRGENASWADTVVLANGETMVSYARWDRFFARAMRDGIITKEDMDFVQSVWDLLEETKGMAQKAFKEYYGYYFEEVQASPVVTPWGIYRGGYVPAATDPALVAGRDKQLEQDLFDSQNEYRDMMPVTEPGWSKSRTKKWAKPLVLNAGILGAHIQSVVKFSMMAPAVKNVQRIVKDRRFAEALNRIDPQAIGDMLTPWLRRSATQTVSTPTDRFGRMLNQARGLAGMSLMAANVANTIQQYTGFAIAMNEVGAKNTALGLKTYLSDPRSAYSRVTEASAFMKGRLEDFGFEFQNEVNRIASSRAPTTAEQVRDWTQRKAYFLQTLAQKTIDIPVWLAAYNQAITEKGMTDEDAAFYADGVVRRTQSSFDPENVARVETGSPLARSILVFYNYFNMQWNLLREHYQEARQTKRYGRFILDFAMIVVLPAVLSEVISQAFSGFDTGDDDDWDAVDGMALMTTAVNKNVVAMLPYVGNIINMTGTRLAKGDYGEVTEVSRMLFGSNPYNDRLVSVPLMSLFENSAEGLKNALLLLTSDEYDPDPRRSMRNTLDLLTLATGIPFAALKKPAGYAAGVVAGEIEPDSPVDFARGIISGRDVDAE